MSRGPRGPAGPVVAGSFVGLLAIALPNAYGASVPGVSAATGVGVATVGQLTTLHASFAAAGLALWVWASRRLSTAAVVRVGLSLVAVGALGVAVNPAAARSPSDVAAFVALAAAVAVVAMGFGLTVVALNTLLANRGASAGLLNAANGMFGAGAVLLPAIVGTADLRVAALVTSGLVVLALPWLWRAPDLRDQLVASRDEAVAVRARRRQETATDGRAVSDRLHHLWHGNGSRPWVWMFAAAIGVEIGTAAWASTHLVGLGIDERRAATAVAWYFGSFTAARFVVALAGDRLPARGTVVTSHVVAAVAAASAAVVPSPVVAWALVGLGVGPVFGTSLAWLTRATGDPDGARRMNVGGAVGGVLLPGSIGLLVGAVGSQVVPWAIAACAAAAAVLAATLPPADGRRPDTGAAASAPTRPAGRAP